MESIDFLSATLNSDALDNAFNEDNLFDSNFEELELPEDLREEVVQVDSGGGDGVFDSVEVEAHELNDEKIIIPEEEEEIKHVNHEDESDAHLPRVQEELDKLNYANESINNLELELEECKREYLQLVEDSDIELNGLEKKLGSCVSKAIPYYDARIELNKAKERYTKAHNKFEAAQALYAAAKEMETYAEENLEFHSTQKKNSDGDDGDINEKTFIDILQNAKIKAIESEKSKQLNDKEQIDAYKLYEEKHLFITKFEKKNKSIIEKSREYYERKASINKELDFQKCKIEGLKSCLKEAKLVYQQSLNNLETISTEVHLQRQLNNQSQTQKLTTTSKTTTTNNKSSTDSSTTNTEYLSLNFDLAKTNNNEGDDGDDDLLVDSSQHTTSQSILSDTNNNSSNGNGKCSKNSIENNLNEEKIEQLSLDDSLNKYKNEIKLRPQFRTNLFGKNQLIVSNKK